MLRRVARQVLDQIGNCFGLAGVPSNTGKRRLRTSKNTRRTFENRTAVAAA